MKIFSKLILFLAVMPFMSFISCSDEEGEGGKAKISGVVYKVIDGGDITTVGGYGFVRDTVIATDVDVYLIYGGDQNSVYDDKTKTSHNGRFEFDYLRSGDYSLFTYSDDGSYVMRGVHCDKKGTTEVEPIFIVEGKNAGKCGIVGNVEMTFGSTRETVPGIAVRVYLRKEGQMSVSDTRTDDNGSYYFSRLEPNTRYVVWIENEAIKNGAITAVSDTVTTGVSGTIVGCKLLEAKVY